MRSINDATTAMDYGPLNTITRVAIVLFPNELTVSAPAVDRFAIISQMDKNRGIVLTAVNDNTDVFDIALVIQIHGPGSLITVQKVTNQRRRFDTFFLLVLLDFDHQGMHNNNLQTLKSRM
jgi:hypothetical protein